RPRTGMRRRSGGAAAAPRRCDGRERTGTRREGTMTALEQFLDAWHPQLLGRLDEHVGRLRWSAERIRTQQRDRVRALLARAIASSPFHRRRVAGIDPATFELADLPRIPVMTKADLMDRFEDVVTDRELTLAGAERALAATTTRPVPILD